MNLKNWKRNHSSKISASQKIKQLKGSSAILFLSVDLFPFKISLSTVRLQIFIAVILNFDIHTAGSEHSLTLLEIVT